MSGLRGRSLGGDYPVGYAKPPVATRFQPGQSGNPKGRPKPRRDPAAVLADILHETVTIEENGRRRKMTMWEVILRRIVNEAARGDLKALRAIVALPDRYAQTAGATPETADLAAEDEAIIADFLNRNGLGVSDAAATGPQDPGDHAVGQDTGDDLPAQGR